MLDFLDAIDRTLFEAVNGSLANPVTDWLMPIITSDNLLRVLYAIAMVLILIKGDRRWRWLVLGSVLVLVATDQVVSQFLKKLIERPRPCHVLDEIHLLVNCGGGYAMPSSHAANAFGQAVLFAAVGRRMGWALILFATLVALSRVFVGVHYPFDIVVGAAIGAGFGWLGAFGHHRFIGGRMLRGDAAIDLRNG